MQKKLIALAVAGLMSAPVFAQSNVTIYGLIDMGYKWQGDNVRSNVGSRSAVDSGITAGNRLGFRGTEDLGNGLKASFVYETGLNGDTAGFVGGGFHRQSYVALSGNFGTVALGRQYTPQHLWTSAIDPFGKGNVGSAGNVLAQDARLDNLAAYVSPTFGGFSVIAAFTNSHTGNETSDNKNSPTLLTSYGIAGTGTLDLTDMRVWAIAPSYKNGPLFVGLNVHQGRENAQNSGLDALKVWDLYGSYDLGVVKLGAIYGKRTIETTAGADIEMKQWLIGATVPVGANGKVLASYNHRTTDFDNGTSDARVGQWAVGYEHALSKRTSLYAAYAHQNQNSRQEALSAAGNVNTNGDTLFGVSVGDATSGNGLGYQRGLAVGVRHTF